MSVTERKPLARVEGGHVIDEHLDKRGTRRLLVARTESGVHVRIVHSDGRTFDHTLPCP